MDKLLFMAADLNEKEQAEFFNKISSLCNDEELTALKIGIAYFRLLKYPELKEAIKATLAKQLYNEFNMEG